MWEAHAATPVRALCALADAYAYEKGIPFCSLMMAKTPKM
jgi:hypothetical protein